MKERVKCAAAVVKKQFQSCCPYGSRTQVPDREELEDVERRGQDDGESATRVFSASRLHRHHAEDDVCRVPKVVDGQVEATTTTTKSSSSSSAGGGGGSRWQLPIMCSNKIIIQGTTTTPIGSSSTSSHSSHSNFTVLQSAAVTCKKKLYTASTTFSPWTSAAAVKPPPPPAAALKPPELLEIFSPLYYHAAHQSSSSSLRPPPPAANYAPELLQIPSSSRSPPPAAAQQAAIRSESHNAFVDSATTLSIDFSPISDDSSQIIHVRSESRWGGESSPTLMMQQQQQQQQTRSTIAKHVCVPRGPLFHPSFEIVSSQGLESSSGATSPLDSLYSGQHLKSKLLRNDVVSVGDDEEELPSIRAAAAAAFPAAPDELPSTRAAAFTMVRLHAPGPPPPPLVAAVAAAASPGRAGLRDVSGSRGARVWRNHEESSHAAVAIKLGIRKPVTTTATTATTTTVVSSSSCEAHGGGGGGGCPRPQVQSPHSRGSATNSASGPVSNGSLPFSDGLLRWQQHPETVDNIRRRVPAPQSHCYNYDYDYSVEEDVNIQAAVKKIQVAFRDYRSGCYSTNNNNKRNASDGTAPASSSSCCDAAQVPPVRLLSPAEVKKEGVSLGSQISRTEAHQAHMKKKPQQQQQQQLAVAPIMLLPAVVAAPWNASIHTAQDYKAILRRKQEAAMKRDRALQYALSHQHWKRQSSKLQPRQTAGGWSITTEQQEDDDGISLDKAGWIWNWLERAARLGGGGRGGVHHHHHHHHGSSSQEPIIFDNKNFSPRHPQSESLSVKSSVGICTSAELGSYGKNNNNNNHHEKKTPVGWSDPDQWPLSLRQQHSAGLLQASHHDEDEDHHHHHHHHHLSSVAPPRSNDDDDDRGCVSSSSRNGHGVVRKLKFGSKSLLLLQQNRVPESVGSCCVAGEQEPTPTTAVTCRLSSHLPRGGGGGDGDRSVQLQ